MLDKTLNITEIRKDFPILHQVVNGHPLIYFDNAATSQKPKQVIEAVSSYYETLNANVHRGAHYLADKATTEFENTRKALQKFLNAQLVEEIIFTKGTTESINIVAHSFGKRFVEKGDEIIISGMEHHANIVPWQMLCEEKGAILKVIPITDKGELRMDEYARLLTSRTKLVAVAHVSNVLGTVNPVNEIIRLAHQVGAKVLLDGAQSSPHFDLDVQALDADFFVFSSHKIYGPTGVGVLYGKKVLLDEMPPYQGGGEMIKEVTFEKTIYNDLPHKFEAGTPNIADVIALQYALDFLNSVGKKNIAAHENELLKYATQSLSSLNGLRIIGTAAEKVSVISFVIEGVHHYDLGMMLDANGIAIRTGHHCAQPLMKRYGVEGTARASFAVYNTTQEIDTFVVEVEKAMKVLV
jgi:cysteine desulfurase/selenocysteine lyase